MRRAWSQWSQFDTVPQIQAAPVISLYTFKLVWSSGDAGDISPVIHTIERAIRGTSHAPEDFVSVSMQTSHPAILNGASAANHRTWDAYSAPWTTSRLHLNDTRLEWRPSRVVVLHYIVVLYLLLLFTIHELLHP